MKERVQEVWQEGCTVVGDILWWLLNVMAKVATFIMVIVIVVLIWNYDSGFWIAVMDLNLRAIKWPGEFIQAHPELADYQRVADTFESGMRVLAGEKAVVFLEVGLVLRILGWTLIWGWRHVSWWVRGSVALVLLVAVATLVASWGWFGPEYQQSVVTAWAEYWPAFWSTMHALVVRDDFPLIFLVGAIVLSVLAMVISLSRAKRESG